MITRDPGCTARFYASQKSCAEDGARFDVVYTTSTGLETDRQPVCFNHGIVEVDRHHAAAGIANADLVGPVRPRTTERESTP